MQIPISRKTYIWLVCWITYLFPFFAEKFSQEKLIPCIQDIKRSKWPYSRYFYTFSFEEWSLSHFEDWVLQNYKVLKKEVYNRCFFKIIRKIKQKCIIKKRVGNFFVINALIKPWVINTHNHEYNSWGNLPKCTAAEQPIDVIVCNSTSYVELLYLTFR